ncbi:MAG TPA: glutathione S-transferase family protein [Burkholderiales bacterium]|nr:glutathione S-transferase family protein [Burkholderiales bacterium]
MKLYLNKASPYARLVLVVAHEKGLPGRIELVWTDPWASSDELLTVNPFSKVPALVLPDGQPLVESGCICDYLDGAGEGRRLMPAAPAERVPVLRKYGFGRALIDSAFGAVIDRRYSAGSTLATRWIEAVNRGVGTLGHDVARAAHAEPDLGDLAIAVGLSYLDFRLREIAWRAAAPRLANWFEHVNARPSMQRTAPE